MTKWTEIILALQGAGIRPIACTVTPRNFSGEDAYQADLKLFNQMMRTYCETNNIILCDWTHSLFSHSTGKMDTAFLPSGDSVHPNITGHWRLGKILAEAIQAVTLPIPVFPDFGSSKWVTSNPHFTGNVSGKATNWNIWPVGSAAGTGTKVARTDGMPGEMQQVSVSGCVARNDGAALNFVTTKASGGYSDNEMVYGVAELEFDPSGFAFTSIGMALTGSGGTAPSTIAPWEGNTNENNDLTRVLDIPTPTIGRSITFVSPPVSTGTGTTQLNFEIRTKGNGTYRVKKAGVVRM